MEKNFWTRDAMVALIDAYREEPCLYAVQNQNYHNKHLRAAALKRVCIAVGALRPGTSGKECTSKFHNMSSQFNLENGKVKASVRSGAGTEDVYKPSLWDFDPMKFLEKHTVPRKSRTTLPLGQPLSLNLSQDADTQRSTVTVVNEGFSEDGHLNVFIKHEDASQQALTPQLDIETQPTSSDSRPSPSTSRGSRPSPSTSPGASVNILPSSPSPTPSSLSGMSTRQQTPGGKKRRLQQNDNTYVAAIQSIADSLKAPIALPATNPAPACPTDPVDACMCFLATMLKEFKSQELNVDVVGTLVQTVLNAKATDLERSE